MSVQTYETTNDYLAACVKKAVPTLNEKSVHVYTTNATDLGAFLTKSGVTMPAVLCSYDDFTFTDFNEDGEPSSTGATAFIYLHARGLNCERAAKAIARAIRDNPSFQVEGESYEYNAHATGGRYMALDRGFDTFQMDIRIQ